MRTFLSQTAEYALRAVAGLALAEADAPMRAEDLSKHTGIPPQYLAKILRRLVLAGVLESRKGQGGGFRLARPAEEIRFLDVFLAVDVAPQPGRCAFGWGDCPDTGPCPLHEAWDRMASIFWEWASSTTFGDVQEGRRGPPIGTEAP